MSSGHSTARRSRRTLFPSSDDALTPSSPGKPSQQLRAGDPAPGRVNSSSTNDGVQEEEEKASANKGLQEEEKEKEKVSANEGLQEEEKEKASTNEGVQEEAVKTDLSASRPESNPPAGKKKKPHLAMSKGKKSAIRVWSTEDEVRILECLAAHVKAHGAPPARAQLLHVVPGHNLDKKEFTLVEIYEKVRRMRDRYYSMAESGAPPRGDAKDLRKYELSGEIWGDALPVPKREMKESRSGQAPETRVRREFEELRRMYPHLTSVVEQISTAGRGCLKRAFEFIDDSIARELDAKAKKQRILEMKTELDRDSARREVLSTLVKYMA